MTSSTLSVLQLHFSLLSSTLAPIFLTLFGLVNKTPGKAVIRNPRSISFQLVMLKRKIKNPNTLRFPPNIPGPSADPRMRVSLYLLRRSVMAPNAHRCCLALHKTESPDENRGMCPRLCCSPYTASTTISRHGPDAASQELWSTQAPAEAQLRHGTWAAAQAWGARPCSHPLSLGSSANCHRGHPYSPASL